MAVVTRAEAVITATNNLKPGLSAAAKELEKFASKQSKIGKANIAQAERQRALYADIGAKVQGFSAALDGIAGKRSLAKMTGHVAAIRKDLAAAEKIDVFRSASRRLDEMAVSMKAARQEAAKARQITGTGADATVVHDAQKQRALERATKAFRDQGAATRQARSELADAGIAVKGLAAAEAQLKRNIEGSTGALQRQAAAQARSAQRREGAGALAGVAGLAAANAGKNIGKKAVVSIADFDIAVRKQREFTDISEGDQNRLLIPQAKRIGQDTQFSNLDIVKAQTAAMQGLPSTISGTLKAEVAQGMIDNAKNYALIMESGMTTAAEAMRSYLQTTGQDISTKEKAVAAANKATNQLVRMAKLGGMNNEDVEGYLKYAASSGTAAGISPESLMSIAALARRGGLRGDEAGVFMRATSSKLVAPTKKGVAALNAAGIKHSDYVKMPSSLDVEGLEGAFQNQLGTGFNPAVRAALAKVLSDPKALADQGTFVSSVTGAVEPQFGKTKKGTLRPADRVNIAKAAGSFYQNSASSVDAEGLLDKIMSSSMTLAQLNSILTDKHGGKGAITQRQRDEYTTARQQLRDAGNDPDYAKRKADAIMGGVGGSFEQAKGAIDNFVLSIGEANAGLIKFGADAFSNTLGMFDQLSTEGKQAATALGALGAAGAGIFGAMKLFGLINAGPALTGSATALTESAVALNAAAARLAGGGAVGPAATAAAAGGASWLARAATMIPIIGIAAAAAAATSVIGSANREKFAGVSPGEPHNEGRNRRRAFNDQLREQTRGIRSEVEALGPAGDGAGSALGSGIEAGVERAKAAVKAAVTEMQRDLDSLHMPALSRGMGGLPTGKQGAN